MNPKQLEYDDKKYIWHPFTQMMDYEREIPLVIDKGKGNYLYDIYGRKYLDGVSSLWVNVHGHRKNEIDKALWAQSKKVSHSTLLGLSNAPAIMLAKELVRTAPGNLCKVFFSDNGSTAVEVALKIAFQYWAQKDGGASGSKKKNFISFSGAYHGDTIGSVSVGGIGLFHKKYKPLLFRSIKIPYPHCYRCPYGKEKKKCKKECVKDMLRIIGGNAKRSAAVVTEPLVQGAAGMIMSPRGYLKALSDACRRCNVLLIVDEVATGFGRTGKMFACEHEHVRPDLMSVAKGITGGYLPLAATLATDEIYGAFRAPYQDLKTFFHGHTYTGNPLAAACALANIKLMRKNSFFKSMEPKIRLMKNELKRLDLHPHVGDIRQLGLMAGIELVRDKRTKRRFPVEEKIGIRVCTRARDMGVILRPLGDVIVLMPPLSIKISEIRMLVRAVEESIKAILG